MIPLPPLETTPGSPQQQQKVFILNTNIPSIPSLPSFPSLRSVPALSTTLQSLQSQLLLSSLQQAFQQQSSQIMPKPIQTIRNQQHCIQEIHPSQPTLFTLNSLNHLNNSLLSQRNQQQTPPNSSVIFITIPTNNHTNNNININHNNHNGGYATNYNNYNCTNGCINHCICSMLCTNNDMVQSCIASKQEHDNIPPSIHINELSTINTTDVNNVLKPSATTSNGIESKRTADNTIGYAYQCKLCQKKFKYQSNLISHRRVHRGDCPKCSYCGKKFARKSNLLQHIRIHTNERPYKCTYCPKAFKQKHSLTDHIRSHTGERPFSCDICFKSFAVKHNLIVHKRIHSGEKPYACRICNTNYSSKSGINSHLKHRHPELWAARKNKRIKNEA